MRDLVILAVFVPLALKAFGRPWIGIMLWTWLGLMNPHRLAWGFIYDAPLAAIAAAITLIGLLFTRERQSPFKGTPVSIFMALSVWMTISWLMGVDVEGSYLQWNKIAKIYFMLFVTLALLHTKHQIMAFAWVTTGSLAILGAKGGIFTILHGGSHRVYGPPGTFIEDNNEFALALIIIIPMLHFLQLQVKNKRIRQGITASMILCAASAFGSHSRGALVAISAMTAIFLWRSRQKTSMIIVVTVFLVALLPMLPEEWWGRMHTISGYQDDASAQGRLHAWNVAWNIALHNFFGGGMSYQHPILFELYGDGNNMVIAAHSIYFQILGNHGFVGLLIFLLLWASTFQQAGWLRKKARTIPQALWASDLGSMVQVGLVGYAVGGAFLSLAYFDLPYNMMVMVVLARQWVENRSWESEPAMPFLVHAGFKKPLSPAGSGPMDRAER